MPGREHSHESERMKGQVFDTTHWSVVLAAGHGSAPGSQEALETLCRSYWYPLYVYIRRRGCTPEDAQDLTQQFFARLLEKKYLRLADPARGKFRAFLLSSLQHFLASEWIKATAAKRGGGKTVISLNEKDAEDRYLAEPADGLTPEKVYEKRWAMTLLDQVLNRLRDEFAADGKADQFEQLKAFLWGEKTGPSYKEMAPRLGMTANEIGVAVFRLRDRYRKLLRTEVAHTVATAAEIDEELRHLIAVISE